jgi:hypothetical protein
VGEMQPYRIGLYALLCSSISVLQHIMDLVKSEPNSDSEMCLTSSESGSQLIHVKQEEVPPFMSLEIKTEHEVSSISTCSFFKHLVLMSLVCWSPLYAYFTPN